MKTTFNIQQMPFTRFGYQVIKNLGDDIRMIGAERALLIIDSEMKNIGLTASVEACVSSTFHYSHVHVIEEKILSFSSIQKALENLGDMDFDVIIGYGGWRCTDLSKVLSIALTNDFSKDMVKSGAHRITNHGIPIVSIPTTPPNGAEIDDNVIIRDQTTKQIHVFRHDFMIPRLTIIDPYLMLTMPLDLTASTGLDSLSHGIEALISMNASPFSEMYALQGLALLKENLLVAFRCPDNITARYNTALGSLYTALALNMTGSGVVHAMSYPLSARYDISHPQASAMMLPYIMKFNLPIVRPQMARIARYFGQTVLDEETDAEKAIDVILELFRQLDHPIDLHTYNVPRIEFDMLVDSVLGYESFLLRNPRILQQDDIKSIYEDAL